MNEKFDMPSDIVIYKTNDYDKFIIYQVNRKLTKNQELEDAITKENKLQFHPIIVSENFEVIDGQHRLDIAKKENLTVYYIIDPEGSEYSIKNLNTGRKNWALENYLEYYSKLGNESYQFSEKIIKKYKLQITTFLYSFTKRNKANSGKFFRDGKMELRYTHAKIEELSIKLNEIKYLFKTYARRKMTTKMENCILQLMTHPDYDHKHFIKNIERYPDNFIAANDFTSHSNIRHQLLDGVYNQKKHSHNRLEL